MTGGRTAIPPVCRVWRAASGWQRRSRWPRWTAKAVVALLVSYLGGAAATSLVPTVAQTRHYQAELRLTPLPGATSRIHSPTSLGNVDLDFHGPLGPLSAPGIDATVQTRENITSVFGDRNPSIAALQPSSAEVTDALTAAASRLALTFGAGALLSAAGALALVSYGRRRPPRWQAVAAAGAAACVTLSATGLGLWLTYQPRNLASFSASGLLGTLRKNAGLLADVENRAQQVTPYVTNLLALSQALQQKFVPQAVAGPAAARFLLVSDIHGANQYPIMRGVIADEKISAVLDTGDLLNFGSVTEVEAAGIFRAIASLGVPYVFVRGNHDAASATDDALLRRLSRIKNVVLLQPGASVYTEVTVGGVSIAGFNDPRWFGDDNTDNAAKQQPAAEAFNRAYADRAVPDVVLSHEPAAVGAVTHAGVLVNGHLHRDELDGNRIGVGTFTGGGTVSHFIPEKGGELVGQPYAFDIAVFGQTCALTSLTRYTYGNLVSGRPAYDNVTVVNGTTIGHEPEPARTCSPDQSLQTATVLDPGVAVSR